jgi:UDP-N-acetyl-D-mannosaminuronic acid dehydrogenase
MVFAQKGFRVHLVDISEKAVAMVNSGTMPFEEEGADVLLPQVIQSGALSATTDFGVLNQVENVIITIGTPVDEYLDPSVSTFDASSTSSVVHMRDNC